MTSIYYHIRLETIRGDSEVKLDLTKEQLDRVIALYSSQNDVFINGRLIPIGEIKRMHISQTDQPSDAYRKKALDAWYDNDESLYGDEPPSERRIGSDIVDMGEDVTDDLILGHPEWRSSTDSPNDIVRDYPNDIVPKPSEVNTNVFVVYGRDEPARNDIFQFLRAIGLHPMEWSEAVKLTGKPNPHVWEILDRAFSEAHAILVLLTPDDEARLREDLRSEHELTHEIELSGQARPNVLFEAGMAMGRSEDRTILVELGVLRPFSDIAGRHTVRLDNTSQRRQELAQRLQAAGCPVKLDGTDWHTVGDFETPLKQIS